MKTISLSLIGVLLILISAGPSAAQPASQPGRQINRITPGSNPFSIDLQLANLNGLRTKVEILNASAISFLSKHVQKETDYDIELDLSDLPWGDYMVCVNNRAGRAVQPIRIGAGGVSLFKSGSPVSENQPARILAGGQSARIAQLIAYFKTSAEGQGIDVRLANLPASPSILRLLNFDGVMMHEFTIQNTPGWARHFNLQGTAEGDYCLYLQAGETSVIQPFAFANGKVALGTVSHHKPAWNVTHVKR